MTYVCHCLSYVDSCQPRSLYDWLSVEVFGFQYLRTKEYHCNYVLTMTFFLPFSFFKYDFCMLLCTDVSALL